MKKCLLLFTVVIFIFNCSKDKKIQNDLKGSWNIESFTLVSDSGSEDISNQISNISFSDCSSNELSNFECQGTLVIQNETFEFLYRTESNNQNILNLNTIVPNGLTGGSTFEILNLLKSSPVTVEKVNQDRIILSRFDSELSFAYQNNDYSDYVIELVK